MKRAEFIKFYDQYAPRIYRFVYLKVNSPQDSEDLTSEAFFKFWDSFGRKKKRIENPQALIYRMAGNLVIDFYRKKSRGEISMDPQDNNVLKKIKDNTDLNYGLNLASDIGAIKKALAKIKPEYQSIIVWRYLDDFSVKEIAAILEKPEGNIRVLVHRALNALKKKL